MIIEKNDNFHMIFCIVLVHIEAHFCPPPHLSQIKVVARDGGVPQLQDETTVEVTVIRDRGTLRFSTSQYRATVSENKAVGSDVVKITASPGVSV